MKNKLFYWVLPIALLGALVSLFLLYYLFYYSKKSPGPASPAPQQQTAKPQFTIRGGLIVFPAESLFHETTPTGEIIKYTTTKPRDELYAYLYSKVKRLGYTPQNQEPIEKDRYYLESKSESGTVTILVKAVSGEVSAVEIEFIDNKK